MYSSGTHTQSTPVIVINQHNDTYGCDTENTYDMKVVNSKIISRGTSVLL